MKKRYFNFIRGVSVNWIGKLGVVLTTSSFFTFLIMEIPRVLGFLTNAYIGLISYLLLPSLFIVGLILIPIGWFKYVKASKRTTTELLTQTFENEDLKVELSGSKLFKTLSILTIINILFLITASLRTVKFMDEAEFCGTACHSVMKPGWVA